MHAPDVTMVHPEAVSVLPAPILEGLRAGGRGGEGRETHLLEQRQGPGQDDGTAGYDLLLDSAVLQLLIPVLDTSREANFVL